MTSGALILGHPRSGTTLLRRLLNAHPEIVSPPETHLFGACSRFLQREETAHGVDMGVLAGLHFSGFDDQEIIARLRRLAFGIMDEIALAANKPFWVEKTAFDIFHLDGIELLCDDQVRYIGIVRHPLDVALSTIDFCGEVGAYPAVLHEFIRRYPQPIESFVRSWMTATDSLVDLGTRRSDQTLIIRYEDLVQSADETVSDVLSFLGVDSGTTFLTGALSDLENLGFSDHKSYQADAVHDRSVGRWPKLPSYQIHRLADSLEPYLEMLGYEPLPGSDAPSLANRRSSYAKSLALHAARRVRRMTGAETP